MRILVTGGAGFIGSNFIRYVLSHHPDWRIANLDKLTYAGNLENLRDVEQCPEYEFARGDIADYSTVNALFEKRPFDVIVNFAAESHVDRSILDSTPFIDTNIKGTQVLLDIAKRYGISKFIQVSTDEVYGSLCEKDPPFTEDSPLRPNSPYAASKTSSDLLVRAYHITFGVPTVITRCSNNYGPYQFPEKLIPLMISNALEDRPLPVYGDGQNIRDWIHVDDHCRAIELAILKGISGEIYNIGAGCEIKNLDLVKAVLRVLGKPESLIKFVPDRLGHDRRYAIDARKIERELNWKPKYRLFEVLPDIIEWYEKNESWWRRVKTGEYMAYYEKVYGS
jgi:dTDP-glucose 4,6-dehydratase